MSDFLAATFLMALVTALTTTVYDPRAWLALFFGFAFGYGHRLWRWWVFPLALVVAIAVDVAVRVFVPAWAVSGSPPSSAGVLVSVGILVVGYVAGHALESWLARRRAPRP